MEAHMSDAGSMPNIMPQALGEMGKKYFEALTAMQNEVLETVGNMNRVWLSSAQSKVTLASELFGKLVAARSAPDVATACQDCVNRQLELFAHDGQRLLADGEKLIRYGNRLFSNGSPALGS
jgi:hypothetical protein